MTLLGAGAGLARMMAGARFLSDVVFAGVFMFAVAWGLHRWLYRARDPAPPARA